MALYENIYENLFATLYAFVEAIEARDPYTKQHSSRVTELAVSIGKEMGCSDEELDLLSFSGNLHDIGKLGIPDSILLKPGPLTGTEFEAIKKHPIIGANIVGHLGLLTAEQKIILHHHERWDGKGYPDGLKGESIPFLSRILSVADVYDAMASDRAYRKKLPTMLFSTRSNRVPEPNLTVRWLEHSSRFGTAEKLVGDSLSFLPIIHPSAKPMRP